MSDSKKPDTVVYTTAWSVIFFESDVSKSLPPQLIKLHQFSKFLLIVQCTLGPAQSYDFKKLQVYKTKLNDTQIILKSARTAQLAQTSPNVRFCIIKRAHRRTLLEGLCP